MNERQNESSDSSSSIVVSSFDDEEVLKVANIVIKGFGQEALESRRSSDRTVLRRELNVGLQGRLKEDGDMQMVPDDSLQKIHRPVMLEVESEADRQASGTRSIELGLDKN